MKRLSFLLVIALICSVMVSCNKEGQFSPKKKISKITCSASSKSEYYDEYDGWVTYDESSSNYVSEIWNWNGKQLESIDHFDSDGTLESTEYFVYDGKKLTSINWGGAARYDFIYEKGKLSTIELYSGSTRAAIYDITHDGNKISKISVTSFDAKAANAHPLPSWILNLPQRPQRQNNMNAPKETYTYEMQFKWAGDNVEQVTYLEAGAKEDIYFTYDNKLNPMYGLWDVEGSDVNSILSKNNVTREEYRYDGESDVYTYSYTYSGNVPSTQTSSYNYSSDDYRYSSTSTTIYDYK